MSASKLVPVDHPGRVTKRTTWAVLTAALGLGWAVVVAVLIVIYTDWSNDVQAAVAGLLGGAGVAAILWLRLKRLPASPGR